MKKLTLIAMIMSLLIISLPAAQSVQLNIEKYSGQDNANGFIRKFGDTLTVLAKAEMTGNPTLEVARTRVRFCPEGEQCEYFTSCEMDGSLYSCTYTTTDLVNGGSETYTIKLFDVNDYEVSTKQITIRVDEHEPNVLVLDTTPRISRTGDMSINYRVEDYSDRSGDISYCSGLKDIIITANNQEIKSISPGRDACEKEERFNYVHSTSSSYEGVDICVQAFDYFDQETAPRCTLFQIDNSPPRFTQFKLRDPQGYELSHMRSGQNVVADVYITIEEEGEVDLNSVRADLSQLNPGIQERGPSEVLGNEYIWRDVNVARPENCIVSARATDKIGNTGNATLTCTLPLDDTGPSPSLLLTDAVDQNGTAMLSAKGNIYAEITDDGAGLDRGLAYLDLHSIGLATGVKADRCEFKSGNTWECMWEDIMPTVYTGTYNIRLTQQTRDDVGNVLDQHMEIPVMVDKEAPIITNVETTFVHQTADYGPRAVQGDIIEFYFDISGAAEGYADFTQIGAGDSIPATECTPISCSWDVAINAAGPQNTTIDFEFYDMAKNYAEYSYNFRLYGIRNDTAADYWTSNVYCSPSMIDRGTASLHEHAFYCQVKLTPKNNDADVVYAEVGELTECTGDTAYISELEVINNQFGSRDPHLVFTLAATDYEINELNISCPIFVTSRVGDYFSPFAEREDVHAKIKFYDLPYGEYYSNLENEIQDTMKRNVNFASWLGDIEYWIDTFRTLCKWKNNIGSLIAALDSVLMAIAGIAIVFKPICDIPLLNCDYDKHLDKIRRQLCGKAKGPIEELLSGITEDADKESEVGIFNILDLACKYANCQLTGEEKIGEKGKEKTLAKSNDILGFFAGACRDTKKYLQKAGMDLSITEHETGKAGSPTDVKENLILSATCLCLPGISYNLNKLREINCRYAVCLGDKVLKEGYPRSYCSDEKSYLTCNYVTGQIFDLIPFSWLYNQISSMAQEFYANPISIVAAVSGCVCGGCQWGGEALLYDYCKTDIPAEGMDVLEGAGYIYCTAAKTAAKLGDAIASITQMTGDDYWDAMASNNWCDQAEEMLE